MARMSVHRLCLILVSALVSPASFGNDLDESIAKLISGNENPATWTTPTKSPFVYSANYQDPDEFRKLPPLPVQQQKNQIPKPESNPSQIPSPTLNLINGTATGRTIILNNLNSLPQVLTSECHVFLGIPYAAAPIDQLRFQAPKAPSRWPGSLDASKYGPACSQHPKALPRSWSINEDCLRVNIFKPAISTAMPIVVWIHGGAFLTGSATTLNPTTICRQALVNTVIIITINYRLGPFGFLAHENVPFMDTNIGLRDVAQAAQWAQENAVGLGSDGDRIVLAGHGSGAALISLLLDSGLLDMTSIKGVVLMSGSRMAPWAITKHSWQSTSNLLKEFNCTSVECLKKVDANRISEKASKLWSPYMDNSIIGDGRKFEKQNDRQHFPIIIGFTIQEGTALAVQKLAPANGQPLKEKVTRSLIDLTGEAREMVERRYFYDRTMPMDFFETVFDYIDALSDAYSDFLFRLPSVKEATVRTQQQSSNVYIYSIRHELPLPGNYLPGYKASYHGSDLELFWSPYAKQSRVNLLGAFLQVILHQDDDLPWQPWSPQTPVVLQVSPLGGHFINFKPPEAFSNQSYHNATTKYMGAISWTLNSQRKFTVFNAITTSVPIIYNRKKTGSTTTTSTTVTSTVPTEPTILITSSTSPETTSTTTTQSSTSTTAETTTTAFFNKTENDTNDVEEIISSKENASIPINGNAFWKENAFNLSKIIFFKDTVPKENASTVKENASNLRENVSTPIKENISIIFKENISNETVINTTKLPISIRSNGTIEGNAQPASQQDSLVWVLLGLAVLFLFLFLVTIGGCAAWNRQSYHPHPNRRSRHQGAKVRGTQQRIPPPVAPLETASNLSQPSLQPRLHKESDKQGNRRLNHQNSQSTVTPAHRRPRQPPPNLPPLLTRDTKRN